MAPIPWWLTLDGAARGSVERYEERAAYNDVSPQFDAERAGTSHRWLNAGWGGRPERRMRLYHREQAPKPSLVPSRSSQGDGLSYAPGAYSLEAPQGGSNLVSV